MKNSLSLFQNVKFNIWLLAVLAAASVTGTLLPQVSDDPDKVQVFMTHYPHLGPWFQKMDFFQLYYSWWFCGLLGLVAFDVIVCKILFSKFPGFHTFKEEEWNETILNQLDYQSRSSNTDSLESNLSRIQSQLAQKGYRWDVRETSNPKNSALMASKHRIQRYGSWISHVSIVWILLASLAGALYGFKEFLTLPVGKTSSMQNRPWTVACDHFNVDWYEQSAVPKSFASHIRLLLSGRLVSEKDVIVNRPMEYHKVRFYQATYGPYLQGAEIGVFLRKNPDRSPKVTIHLDEEVPIPGTPYSLKVLQFIPDFSMNERMEVVSRSPFPTNPGLQILILRSGKPLRTCWIFEKYPGLQMPPPHKEDEIILVLAKYIHSYYAGLQVSYDPGADYFWIGCAILIVGLGILFYLHQRKVYLFLKWDPNQKRTHIAIGGYSSRGAVFDREFQDLVRLIA